MLTIDLLFVCLRRSSKKLHERQRSCMQNRYVLYTNSVRKFECWLPTSGGAEGRLQRSKARTKTSKRERRSFEGFKG